MNDDKVLKYLLRILVDNYKTNVTNYSLPLPVVVCEDLDKLVAYIKETY